MSNALRFFLSEWVPAMLMIRILAINLSLYSVAVGGPFGQGDSENAFKRIMGIRTADNF